MMNAYARSQIAYSTNKSATRTEQSIEYELFAKMTSALARSAKSGLFESLAKAVHDNRRLWVTIAADVSDDGNTLPKELRAQIFYLAEFTQHHSSKVLNEGASVEPLIEINRSIMSGLFAQRGIA
jgi:flagellar protein FlaF